MFEYLNLLFKIVGSLKSSIKHEKGNTQSTPKNEKSSVAAEESGNIWT